MLLSFPPPSTCRTSVVSITSLPPNSPCVPDPYGPSSVFRALHYLIHDGHLISKKNQYSGSITQGLAMLHSRPRAQDLDCAESRWQSCWARRASGCPVYSGHLPHVEEKPSLFFQPHRLASRGPCAYVVLPFCLAGFPAHSSWAVGLKSQGERLPAPCFFVFVFVF